MVRTVSNYVGTHGHATASLRLGRYSGQTVILHTDEDLVRLTIGNLSGSRLGVWLNNSQMRAENGTPYALDVGEERLEFRVHFSDPKESQVEVYFETIPAAVNIVREEVVRRRDQPWVGPGSTLHSFDWRTGSEMRLIGPDASASRIKLKEVFVKHETYQLEVNGRGFSRKFFETHFVRLSSKKVSLIGLPNSHRRLNTLLLVPKEITLETAPDPARAPTTT
jgi:hypothetical protein